MTLTTRLSLFFLGALACVLAGFSVSLYAVAHSLLYRQASDRLQATLNTLTAAAEVEPNGVEWEPHQRPLAVGDEGAEEAVCWVVTDGRGREIDHSGPDEVASFLAKDALADSNTDEPSETRFQGKWWRPGRRRIQAGATSPGSEPVTVPPGAREKKYPILIITAAVPLSHVQQTLNTLLVVLTSLSLVLWLAAALAGRWLCRRALHPLTRMGHAARTITAVDLGQRLPPAGTGDELEALGRAFNDLLARLQESFERQRRFTGDASHQLRTPLAAMLGQIEVALRRDRDSEEYQRVLGSVQGQAVRLRQIVEMLLFLARADAEARSPEMERIDLGKWLREHLESWSTHPRWTDFKQDSEPEQPLWVKAHAPLFGQAVDNLLDNALKYSDPGSAIGIRTWQQSGCACLGIEDHGRGIDPEDLPHIFEPFYRAPQTRRLGSSGVGLGLSVAARIMTALGGRIEAASELGKGSRFTVHLPLAGGENEFRS